MRAEPEQRAAKLAEVRQVCTRARDGRQVAITTFNTAMLEPPTDQLDTGAVGVVLSWIRRASDAAIAAETILRHDWPTTPSPRSWPMQRRPICAKLPL